MKTRPLRVQSWPAPGEPGLAEGRSHVLDRHFRQVAVTGNDYRPVRDALLASDAPGVLHIDWDVAVGPEDIRVMESGPTGMVVQARYLLAGTLAVGWGCIYIPRDVLAAWEPLRHDPRLTDTNFEAWLHRSDRTACVTNHAHPIHLHW